MCRPPPPPPAAVSPSVSVSPATLLISDWTDPAKKQRQPQTPPVNNASTGRNIIRRAHLSDSTLSHPPPLLRCSRRARMEWAWLSRPLPHPRHPGVCTAVTLISEYRCFPRSEVVEGSPLVFCGLQHWPHSYLPLLRLLLAAGSVPVLRFRNQPRPLLPVVSGGQLSVFSAECQSL